MSADVSGIGSVTNPLEPAAVDADDHVTDAAPRAPPQQLDITGTSANAAVLESSILVHRKECTLAETRLSGFGEVQENAAQSDNSGSCACAVDIVTKRDQLPHYKVTVQEFFTLSGLGKFQYIHVLCFVFIFMRDGIEVILAALIKPSLSCLWQLNTLEGALVPALPALTYAVGSQVIGILADKYGRRICLQVSLGLTLALDVASSFSDNYIMFIVLRSSAAFFLGGAFATMLTFWTEIVPKSQRFRSLFYFSLFWTTGTVYAVVDGFLTDNADHLDYHFFMAIICLPTAFAFIFSFFIYETPSYYIVSGNIDKAVKLIKEVIVLNNMEPASYDVLCEGTYYDRGAIVKLFQMPYLKVTICFMLISYGVGYTFGGWTVLVSYLFTHGFCTFHDLYNFSSIYCKALTNEAYVLILIAVLGGYPGYVAAYNIAKKTGPMNYVTVTYFFAFYFFVVMNFCIFPYPTAYYFYYFELFTTRALLGGGYLMLWLYTPVYYHTQVRAVGVGLGICCLKTGTATAAVVISYFDLPYKLYSFAGFSLLVTIVAVALSEPKIKAVLFAKTDNVIESRDFEELYKHHHIPSSDLHWHIRNVENRDKKQQKKEAPFVTQRSNQSSTAGPDFNWVDQTPSPVASTPSSMTTKYDFSGDSTDNSSPRSEVPLSAFLNRKVYSDEVTPGKPTFSFDRSRYPLRSPAPTPVPEGKGKQRLKKIMSLIRPSSADLADESTYILTPNEVRSEGNTPDPGAEKRKHVVVKRRAATPPPPPIPSPIYENTKKKKKKDKKTK